MSRKNIQDIYPLSPMQQGMLFQTLLAAEPGVYVVQHGWTLRGRLDVEAFERAWQAASDRHAVLRTAFVWERREEPLQVVREKARVPFEQHDLRGLPAEEQAARLARVVEEDRRRGFDLARAPLMRVTLLRLDDDTHRCLWTSHHLLLDGWSTPLLLREVFALYEGLVKGEAPRLERPRPYGDYIGWLGKQDKARTLAFWRKELAGFRAPTPLGVDHPATPGPEVFDQRRLDLSEEASAELAAFARQHQLTVNTLLFGAWALLLSRYSGEADVLFGATVSGRSAPVPGIEKMIGLFINTLPARVAVDPSARTIDWLKSLHAHQAELREHEHSALVEAQGQSDVPRGTPLFESIFVFENYPFDDSAPLGAAGVTVTEPRTAERTSYPIVFLGAFRRNVLLRATYDTRRLDAGTVDRLLGHVRAILDGFVKRGAEPLHAIAILSEAERRKVLVEWNDTAVPYPTGRLIHELFAEQAAKTPDAVALEFEAQSLTYRELDQRTNQLAHALRKRGIGPDSLVGVCMERSLEMVVALHATLKAGGAYVPLDPEYPRERLAFMLEDARPSVILTQAHLAEVLPPHSAELIRLDSEWSALAQEPTDAPARGALTPDHLAYVIYTSGSTGKPKGAMNAHRGILNRLQWMQEAHRLDGSDRVLQKTPFSFDVSVWEFFWPLMTGARLVVARPQGHKDPAYLASLVEQQGITTMHFVPSMLQAFLADLGQGRCPSLRRVFASGEALPPPLVDAFFAHLPKTELHNLYGPTEAAVDVTAWACAPGAAVVPIGKPIANTRIYLLDERLQPVPAGVRGELYIGGVQVARGYLNRAELTAERFLDDPFTPGGRLYRTGDVARWLPDGSIEYLGRADFQVKLRGFRIELGEIEAALLAHPAVREAVVLAREDRPGDKRLVAYVSLRAGQAAGAAELRAHVEKDLPSYMVPGAFVMLDALPLTASGKVDRKALPAPEVGAAAGRVIVAPRGPIEEALCGIFAEVLKLPADQVGARDGFFELGGHSLLATQAISRIRGALGVDLPLRALFDAPAPADLALRIEAALGGGEGAPPIRREDAPAVLSFAQERLWFLAELEPDDPSYVVPLLVRFEGALDTGALEKAIGEIVRRHEVLRTTFASEGGRPVPVVQPAAPVAVPVTRYPDLAPAEREERARREASEEARRPFDLARGPLLRARLFEIGVDDHLLLLTLHHIVSDAWTLGILNREISALYDAFRAGRPSPLPEPAVQYADYARWQRRWLEGSVIERQLAYWKERLAGASGDLDLPTDRPRPAVTSYRGDRRVRTLSPELARALKDLSRREGTTLFMTLLAGFDALLCRWTGQSDLSVGTPIANRSRAETEEIVGFFLNTLVLRTTVGEGDTFRDLLGRVKAACLGAYTHQDVPFERLVQEIQPARDRGRAPLFQVLFTLQNAPEAIRAEGLRIRRERVENATAKFDLALAMAEGPVDDGGSPGKPGSAPKPPGLAAQIDYRTDLFDASTIERMLGHLEVLLEAAAKAPDRRVDELPLLDEAERRRVLVEWNGPAVPTSDELCAHELFAAQVERTPEAVAVVFGDARITYRELDARSNQLAHRLRKQGVGAEAMVGLSARRSPELVIGMLAVMKAGGAYVPLDPAYPRDRLAFMLADSGVRVLLADAPSLAALPPVTAPVVRLDDEASFAGEPRESPSPLATATSAAYVIYTSGSTGRPKGVLVEHKGLGNLAAAQARGFGIEPGSRVLQFASSNFDASVSEILVTLLGGATLVLAHQDALMPGPDLIKTLTDQAISVVTLPPSALAVMPEADLPALRTLVVAGEACPADIVDRWGRGRRFVNAYGPTETTVCATLGECSPGGGKPSIGRPIDNVEVYLLDARMQPVPVGVAGEIHIGGVGLARGYLNRPELTAEKFVRSPFSREGARLYKTGDLGRWLPDGRIDFLGRIDAQVKLRGYRIELGEIEAVLAEHPAVRAAAVSVLGERLVAYVVPAEGAAPGDLRAFLEQKLPGHMVPATYVTLAALPLSPNGKVDRRALPAPEEDVRAGADRLAPRGPTEEAVAAIFAAVLGVKEVGAGDGFFELGGHSLLATQAVARIRDALGVELPLRALFEAPTVAELAARVEAARGTHASVAGPIPRVSRGEPLPLSFAQERLWFLEQLDPGNASYLAPMAFRLRGKLDAGALGRAMDALVRRHEVLRTTYASAGGRPVQVIHPHEPVKVPVEDLGDRSLPDELAAEGRRPIDLATGPMLRARLIRAGVDDHVLLLTMHHIVSDAWSNAVLLRELGALYGAFVEGRSSPLGELPIQYADYAVWQRGWLAGARYDAELAYWKDQLAGAPAALDLPTDRPRPPAPSYRGARRSFAIGRPVMDAIRALAEREGATPFMALVAAFDVVLARFSGQDDIVIGTPIAGRTRAETEGLVGVFINMLVLRARVGDGTPFVELLRQVREVSLGAYAHQDMPFERLVHALDAERDLSRAPIFQVTFTLQNVPREASPLPGIELRGMAGESTTAKYDLSLVVGENADGLWGVLEFSTDLFDPGTIDRIAQSYRAVLEGAARDPECPVGRLPLLDEAERNRLTVAWNDTARAYPRDASVAAIFEEVAAARPEAVAVTYGEEALTYRELDARANKVANYLRALGVGPEVPVGLAIPRSIEMVVATLGVLKAGGAYVPLDPEYPIDRLSFMLDDSGAAVVLTLDRVADDLPAGAAIVVSLDGQAAEIEGSSAESTPSGATGGSLAYVMYTSGSTGTPKGVCVTNRAIARLVKSTDFASFGPEEVFLQFAPTSFDASTLEIWGPLLNGGRLVVFPGDKPSLAELGDVVKRSGVTTLWLTAGLFNAMVESSLAGLGSLRQLLAGGEALSVPHVKKALAELPGVRIINGYGPTENTTFTCCYTIPASFDGTSVPIGRPIANTRVYVLDPHMEPVPVGVPGELYAGGDGLARGYLHRPELDAERFVNDPFTPGERLYRTGDVVRWLPSGILEFVGRRDQQVKIRGFRIELGEIESLLAQHPAVREAAVLAREDSPGDKRLVAYVVWGEEDPPKASELRAYLAQKLPEYMLPGAYVALEAMPLTPNGKVDRRALPAPEVRAGAEGEAIGPRTPVEQAIAAIWAEVLGMERVGVTDSFFELGGHSLLATQVISRANTIFRVELSLRSLFEAPTVAGLAERIDAALRAGEGAVAPPIERAPREAPLPASFAQERLWFLDQLEPGGTAYVIVMALRLTGRIDVDALRGALNALVARHEALRTTFASAGETAVDDGGSPGKPGSAPKPPVQVIRAPFDVGLPVTDLSALPPEDREAAVRAEVAAEAGRPFDLAEGPLVRAKLHRTGDEEHVLFWSMHHIVSDGWSQAVFNRELGALYEALSSGRPADLPELPIQYADYAVWQRRWLAGEVLDREIAFWRRALEGAPPVIDLPTDRPRSAARTGRAGRRVFTLSPELSRAVKDLAQGEGATPFMTLLAAYGALLARYAGQDDVVVGTPIANRNRAAIEGLIGFFINSLPLRLHAGGDPTFRELVGRAKEVCLGAYAHQDMPFERLVQELAPERDLSRSPIFQVFFNLQNAPREAMALPGLAIRGVPVETTQTKFELTLIMVERSDGFLGTLTYSADLFDDATIDRMVGHFQRLLDQATRAPDARVRALDVLAEDEREKLVVAWNDTRADFPAGETIASLFEAQADRTPDAIAVVAAGGRLSFRDLDARSNRLAHRLRALGVGPDAVVGLAAPRSVELVVGILGVMKAGGAYVPLDPAYPKQRLVQILEDARATVLVTQGAVADALPATSLAVVRLEDGSLAAESDARPDRAARPEHLAYVLFTSGSTGKPKGVAIEHRNLVNYVRAVSDRMQLPAGSSYAHVSTFSADLGNTVLFPPLCLGGTLHVIPQDLTTDPDGLAEYFTREGIDCLKIVPSHLSALLSAAHPERVLPRKLLVMGGEASSWELIERIERLAPDLRIMNHYGPTETTVGVLTHHVERGRRIESAPIVPLGRPLANCRVYVLDPAMNPTPTGVPGEVYVGGAQVARGYLHRPDLTDERFVPSPFVEGERLYRTGDRARHLPDGALVFLGRIDFQVKIRGFRIELGEIEAAIASHPAVKEVVVLAQDDGGVDGAPTGDLRLVAYVVPSAALEEADLRGFLGQRLPDYMVPASIVRIDALPLTPNGKIDRRALPALEAPRAEAEDAYDAPRTPAEEVVASIWCDVFGRARIGVHEGFNELGGHSLLAIQIVARARDAFQAQIPLRAVFEAPTIAAFAERVEEAVREGEGLVAPPITRAPRGGPLPLSFAQERLWFVDQLEPGNPFYNVPSATRLLGRLDVDALRRALEEIVRRHEVLRTTFASVDGKPVQVIHDAVDLPFTVVRRPALDAAEREAEMRKDAAAEARRPFDLAKGPLLRATLFEVDHEEHVLVMVLHHIVSDGGTRRALNRELGALYTAFAAGRPSPLPELPIQYADYAVWQRGWLTGEVLDRQLAYWKKQLEGAPQAIDLPTDRPRPPVQRHRGAMDRLVFSAETTEAIQELCRREGVTLYMTLLAALDVLLHRYTGQGDVVVGTSVTGRVRAETEPLIGFFINALVLRAQVSDDESFLELLARVRDTCLGAYAHQDMPFERLVQELQPEPDPSRSPLFQVIFTMQDPQIGAMQLPGLALRGMPLDGSTVKYDLTFFMGEGKAGIYCVLAYNTDLFDASTIARMLGQFRNLVEGIARDPGRKVRDLPLLGDDERRRLLVEWNAGEAPAIDTCAHRMFEARADATPDAIALVAGVERISFRDLDARANRVAHHLRALGVGPDSVVGLCTERSADFVIGLLGIMKAGGAYVPLDPAYPKQRLAQILDEARAKVLVTLARLGDGLPAAGVSIVRLDADAAAIAAESDARPEGGARPENLAYVLFTSGSTGKPKGVAVEHRNLVSYVRAVASRMRLPEGASHAHVSTFSADLGNTVLFPPLCLGGTLHVIAQDLTTDPNGLAEYFTREGIDCLKIVPSHLSALLSAAHPERVLPRKLLVMGGEASSWELIERIEKLAPELRIMNHYGPTETTVGVITHEVERGKRIESAPIVPLGRPLPGVRLYVLDASMGPTPTGVPGELYVGGAQVARGYLHRPDLTDERFVPSPFVEGERLYRTGDRVRYLPDGALVFLGRIDFQVKIRGFRVELGEIEAAIAAWGGVKDAVVLAVDDGAGNRRLSAFLVPVDPGFDVGALRRALEERLPDYMVPASMHVLGALPLTPNGKIDRRALEAIDRRHEDEEEGEGDLPRTPAEEVLAGIWADVFERDRVGIHERFADLGGHSLLAIQIVARAREAFQVQIPLRAIFEAPTVASLAERVEAALRDREGLAIPPLERAPRDRPLPLSFAQERLWFLAELEPENPSYNVPSAFRVSGPLDVGAFERALAEVARRHEVLRTTFAMVDGRPVQVIHDAVRIELPIVDLGEVDASAREAEARRLTVEEARAPFDLARGPLLRARLLRLGSEDHVLVLTMHHIVSDAQTRGVLHREVTRLYAAFAAGRPSPLPELPIQYADYAAWQRRFLEGEVLDRQMAYWKEQLAGAPEALELPVDRPRPPVPSGRGAQRPIRLSQGLTRALEELSRREGATLFMTLLAAFDLLLYRHTGQPDVLVGSPILNRSQPATEPLVGVFLNTLVLRARIDEAMTFAELVQHVRDACIGAYAHQDAPFERLVQALAPARDLSRTPLFQVLFTLQSRAKEVMSLPGIALRPMGVGSGTAKFDLALGMMLGPDGLVGSFEYATDLFEPATIDRLAERFAVLLEAAVEAPDARIAQIPVLPEAERQRVLVAWNDTRAPFPDACLHELVEQQADRTPDAVALVAGRERITYRDLDARANRVAHALRRRGVGPEVRVGLCVTRRAELVTALLGVLKAGGAYVPLDPVYPKQRLAQILDDARVPVLITERSVAGALPDHGAALLLVDGDDGLDRESDARPDRSACPSNLAYVIYTSGSTGRPKGVAIEHRSPVCLVSWAQGVYAPAEYAGVLFSTSVCFDLSIFELFLPLASGGKVVLADNAIELPSLPAAAEVTLVNTVPTAITELVRMEGLPASVRTVCLAGEPLAPSLAARIYELPHVERVYNLYGPTEDTTYSTFVRVPRGGAVTVGRPIANGEAYIVDARGEPVPIGVPGEILLGGAGLARGYLGRPDLTAERFVPHPFSHDPNARLYHTGDLGRYLPNGEIEYLGRIDHQVKIRGFRIELGEIESVLRQHPSVRDLVVVAREDSPGEKRLVAYLVFAAGPEPTVADLRAFLRERLPDFMVPHAFVTLPALPLTANGKIDRKALPVPEARVASGDSFVAPRNEVEETLARIWAGVLRLERVSVRENFFELGGDSVLSIQIVARARQAGVVLTPRQLFQHPTIEALAAAADRRAPVAAEQGPVVGDVPLTPVQRWWIEIDPADPHHWNQSSFLEARGRLDAAALEKALASLFEHHDALRLRLARGPDGTAMQRIVPPGGLGAEPGLPGEPPSSTRGELPLRRLDFAAVPDHALASSIEKAASDAQASLSLDEGPIARAVLFDLGEGRPSRLLLVVHHLAVDAVSWRVIVDDLWSAYAQALRGEAIALPPKTTSFKRWAEELAAFARTEALAAEAAFWLDQARSPVGRLPVDHDRGENTEASARSVVVSLGPEDTEALLREVPEAYRTQINDALLTALAEALGRFTGSGAAVVDLEGHGREELFEGVDLTRSVGWFTAVYPVVLVAPAGAGPGGAIKAVKEQLRAIPNRGVGYGVLRYLAGGEVAEKLRAAPAAEVSFNYLGQLDQALPEDAPLRRAREASGPPHSPRARRRYLVDVNASILGGRLQARWTYSENVHRRATIEAVANAFVTALRDLVEHCRSEGAKGLTPSDFQDVSLSQGDLDMLSDLAGED